MSATFATLWPVRLAPAAIDIWQGRASWWALLITALIGVAADVAVFLKCLWTPLRRGRQLARQLQEVGVTAPVPRLSALLALGPLTLAREAPAGVVRADAMLNRLRRMEGLTLASQTEAEIVIHGLQSGNPRVLAAQPTNFVEARIAFLAGKESVTKLACQVRFGRTKANRMHLLSAGTLIAFVLLQACAFPVYWGYVRMVLVALAAYLIALLLAYWLGQRLLTENFLDALILESARRP
jgi:hypothetical protein